MKRFIRGLMAVAASLGLMGGTTAVVVTATPGAAQAWGICTASTADNHATFADNQGMCGLRVGVWFTTNRLDKCIKLSDYGINDWAGSVWNRTDFILTVYQHANCTGRTTWLPARGIEYNLYDPKGGVYSLGNRASAIKWERR